MTRAEIGTVFPPRDEWDIAAYASDEVVEGYREHERDGFAPGENHSPGFRWGWANARRDATGAEDGFDRVRHAYIKLERSKQ